MSPLIAMLFFLGLLIAHLIGDWLIQTEHQALNKDKGGYFNLALMSHCAWYTLIFVPVFWIFGVSFFWLILIFTSHQLLDKRKVVMAFCRVVKQTSEQTLKNLFWLVVVVDQVLHFLVLCFIFFATLLPQILLEWKM